MTSDTKESSSLYLQKLENLQKEIEKEGMFQEHGDAVWIYRNSPNIRRKYVFEFSFTLGDAPKQDYLDAIHDVIDIVKAGGDLLPRSDT
jgi:hypothetical protein